MTRQYIGARYVPKFSELNNGNWDNTYSYEPLTIVKYGNDFYTSRIPVPVGAAITDTHYWVKTGDYNGAISQLQTQIDQKVDKWSGRQVLFLGDSYEGYYVGTSIANIIVPLLGITAYQRVYGGGYGFSAEIDHPGSTWKSLLENTMVAIDPDTMIIYGGLNDEGASDLEAKMIEFDSYVRGRFPNLQNIYLAFIGFSFRSTLVNRTNIREACETYRKKASELGWHFLEGCQYISRDFATFDGTIDTATYRHPSAAGIKTIAYGMTQALLSGYFNYENSYQIGVTPDANITVGGDPIAFWYRISNGRADLDTLSASNVTFATAPVNNVGFDFGELNYPVGLDTHADGRYMIMSSGDIQYLGRIGINGSRTIRCVFEGLNVPAAAIALRLREIHTSFPL